MEKLQPKLRFPEFKENWVQKKISEVSTIGRGKSKHRPRDAAHLYGGKHPFIQTGDIRNAGLYLTTFTQTYSDAGLIQSKLWEENTLCITIAANIAETAILKIKACFPDSIIGLIPNENDTIVLFVKYQFDKFKIEIQSLSQGVAQANLNQEKLSNIEFNFPTIPEQTKIASFLSTIDEKLNLLKDKKTAIEEYKKGMMQKIFSQELRFKDENGKDFAEWEKNTLGDICDVNKGAQLNRDTLSDSGLFPCISGGIEPSGYALEYNRNENTIIISEGGNSCGYVNFITSKFWCGGHCYSIDIKDNSFDNFFLFQALKYYQDEIMKLRVGSGLPNIQKKDLLKFNLTLSIDLKEQSKIATFLSAIDEKIELVSQQIEDTQVYKRGLLQQLFC